MSDARVSYQSRESRNEFPHWGWFEDASGAFKIVPADAIVIERDELDAAPHVSDSGYLSVLGAMFNVKKLDALQSARDYLIGAATAVAYVEAHPPVDEAQVEALATDLTRAAGADVNPVQVALRLDIARELIRGGWSQSADKHDLEES